MSTKHNKLSERTAVIRRLLISSLLCLYFLGSLGGSASVHHATAQGNPANEMIQLVNAFRASHGLPAYQVNGALTAAAQNHANWMAQTAIYSHTGAGGSTPQTRATAAGYGGYATENIVGGSNMTPRQGLIWWQNSAIHYNTLVSTRYVDVGVAFTTNGSQNFYVLVAGQPTNTPPGSSGGGPAQAARPLIITPIQLAQPREDGSIIHTVQPGQALWSLAAHYEVTLSDILLLNNLRENSFLQPGDELIMRLPEGVEPPPTPTPPLNHIVQRGQTLWTIAGIHRVRLGDLLWLNNLTEDAILQPGQEITIHLAEGQAPPPTPTPILMHTVRSGQTLWDIAITYGLTLDQLLAFNGITADKMLHPGEALQIRPADPTPTDTPTSAPEAVEATPLPVQTATATLAPSPTPTLTPQAAPLPSTTPLPVPRPDNSGEAATTGIVLLGLGMMILAAVVWARNR